MKTEFDVEILKKLLSKKWQKKEEGILKLVEEVPNAFTSHGVAAQEHVMFFFKLFLKEKLPKINEANYKLLPVLLEESARINLPIKFESNNTEGFITQILEKCAELNKTLASKSLECM